MEDQEIIKEFLIESSEGLTRLEQEIVDLEKCPSDPALLGSIFRTVHSIKGACGFLGFTNLENVTHIAESILSQLRNGERHLSTALISLVLETMDAIKTELASIESTFKESGDTYDELRRRLTLACSETEPASPMQPAPAAPAVESNGTKLPEEISNLAEDILVGPASAEDNRIPLAVAKVDPHPSAAVAIVQSEEVDKLGGSRNGSIADSTIRVDVGHLDKVMNLVGELVLARNQILQYTTKQDDASLNATAQRLNLITTQLQEGVMKTRMQPIGVVWNKLPRVVRDLATSCGKQIELEMDGAETELDKSIIEAIKDPLTHIVRNCCDHGIELPADRLRKGKPAQGRLVLRAYHEGGQVNIEIIDDGGGIDVARVKRKALERGLLRPEQAQRLSDREAANLVFLPGFSTAEKVTSISGRGVGMDVVKTNIEKIGGIVDLTSHLGEGTTVKIKIPLTLAIIPGLLVSSGGERFVIPQVSLLELLRLEGEAVGKQIERIHGTPVYRRRGSLLPIAYLNEVLKLDCARVESEVLNIVVLQAEDRQFGLVVDAISDTQEIVVKPLGKQLKGLTAFAGATIMGDGGVALILDVLGIGQLSGVVSESRDQSRLDAAKSETTRQDTETFLLFRAGKYERLAVPLSLVARLEEFPHKQIEHGSGKMVVQYRDRILHLISLPSVLQNQASSIEEFPDPAQVIVFAEEDRMVGLIVDQIVDIHSESIRIIKKSDQAGLSGSAVIGGKVTDFLDLPAVLNSVDEFWSSERLLKPAAPVLVADSRGFSRGLVRNYLELAGHSVIEAVDQQDAMDKLNHNRVAAAIVSNGLSSRDAKTLTGCMRDHPNLARIPVVTLFDSRQEIDEHPAGPFEVYVERFDRKGLIASLEQLSVAREVSDRLESDAELAGSAR
jgi:two-component system chemotaxis sensor kinase CheA